MQIDGLKTSLVKEGQEQEFEALFGELRAAIQNGEPAEIADESTRLYCARTVWR